MIHDCSVVDGDGNVIHPSLYGGRFRPGAWRNMIRNRYTGCCMAFQA